MLTGLKVSSLVCGLKVSSLVCKWVFYRPGHNVKGRPHETEF